MSAPDIGNILTRTTTALAAGRAEQGLPTERPLPEMALPAARKLQEVVERTRAILFPGYFGHPGVNRQNREYHIGVDVERLFELLAGQVAAGLALTEEAARATPAQLRARAEELAASVVESLPELRERMGTDVKAAYEGDPAARSVGEVICCYPAIRAIGNYRLAHELWKRGVPMVPRILTEMAHSETGIDIHPGARIGTHFSIDHGTGVVIGETCVIGDRVKLYQGVTLGAKNFPLDHEGKPVKGVERHPILEDDVIVYSNATILGRITVGRGAVVGGNIWVTEDVPPGARIVQRRK